MEVLAVQRSRIGRAARVALCALLGLGLGTRATSGAEPRWPGDLAVAPLAWTGLIFQVSGWLGEVRAELSLWTDAAGREAPGAPLAVPIATRGHGGTWVADLTTRIDPTWLPRRTSEFRAWFDPADGAVSGSTKLSLGPRPDRKIYRFTREGAERVRIEPRPGEAAAPPERWSQVVETFHPFRLADVGCRVVSDPAVLLFKISSLDRAGQAELAGHCVFSGKTLFEVDVEPLGVRRLAVDYRLRSEGAELRRAGRVAAVGFRVRARPVAGELDEDEVRLDLYVEEASRLPVLVRARVEVLGEVDVALAEVVAPRGAAALRPPAPRPGG